MKTEFEKQALCGSDKARQVIRKRIAKRKAVSFTQIDVRQDAQRNILRDEGLEALADDELVLSIFFSENIPDVRIAKDICKLCQVKDTCLQNAVQLEEAYGVWGGQFFKDGVIDTPKRRGRPPKVAKPEYEVPEVAISPNIKRLIEAQKVKQKAA